MDEQVRAVTQPALGFNEVSLVFGGQEAGLLVLDRVSLQVQPGTITSVVGPSGCGKTTLLRLASGLMRASSGAVFHKGERVDGLNAGVGFVTQESNLFPWLSALDNVAFPLAVRGVPRKEREERAHHWLKLVGLQGFERHYPAQLSGGMQKRVAIVRTLIYEPDVVLLDEPFGALDAQTRMALHSELLGLWDQRRCTMLFITHDLVEAITLSDQIVIMSRRPGRVKRVFDVNLARPRQVFEIFLQPGFDAAYAELWESFKAEIDVAVAA